MTRVVDLHKKWMKAPAPEYVEAYKALEEEFARLAAAARHNRSITRPSVKRGNGPKENR
jgi:hypothetical protein